MKTSFSALNTNIYTRKFGGTVNGVAEPYLTGTHFIWFDVLPKPLSENSEVKSTFSGGEKDIQNYLAGTCLSVTPPGGTLAVVDFGGLGGIKWGVPGNIDYGNTVSIKFLEFQGLPTKTIFHNWVKMIRDYRTGVGNTGPAGADASSWKHSNWAATLYYWTTTPDGETIEYYACYDGVFPLKDPQDLYSSDLDTVGRLDVEIEFHLDYVWHENWVKTKVESLKSGFTSSRNTMQARTTSM